MNDSDAQRLHTTYYAIRVVRPPRKGIRVERWLFARLKSSRLHHFRGKFYEKDQWERPEWLLTAEAPTWFETAATARRRLRTKAIKEKVDRGWRAEIVKVRLIAHTDVVWTSEDDAVLKLGRLVQE